MEIQKAITKEDFIKCWDVVKELRPHLDVDSYLTFMLYMLDEHYKAIFIEIDGKAVSYCGYRVITMLDRGRSMYIDDLATLPEARGKGYATALLKHVIRQAKSEDLKSIQLDSGYHHFIAHKLYLNEGFKISAHHFTLELLY
ncbi:MAG TPA: GNAT family N-acetyltransferase [Flavisolibacter sp.]|jgi:GNAT superfamily N-acetyltransferase|nr:GNAT family N-acetyltransferase [Flavisolibacter sp.]